MADYFLLTEPEEAIFWKALESRDIIKTLNGAEKLTVVKTLREQLMKIFPEISLLPRRCANGRNDPYRPSADFWIAMALTKFQKMPK